MQGNAIILAPFAYRTDHAKTAHGLVRGSERFVVVGIVDPECAGHDAGTLLDGMTRGIPIFSSLAEAIAKASPRPDTCIVGIATGGGLLPASLRAQLLEAVRAGLHVVNGLHEYASDDPQIAAAAAKSGASIVDVRKPRPKGDLHFWSGAIADVRAPRVAVLGTDCALGKRTTARLMVEACRGAGMHAEMIYTGQTGFMQGGRFGFILDSVVNDFVAGELEHAIVTCDRETSPEVIFLEGQSALRNPSGPCGAELIVSGQARGVILQHAPGRAEFKGHHAWKIPPIEEEIELLRLYGTRPLAVTLNHDRMEPQALIAEQKRLSAKLGIPVVRPLEEGLSALLPVVRAYVAEETSVKKP